MRISDWSSDVCSSDLLAEDPAARRIEPQSYDLTLVVFTDYQCPFCRQMHPRLTALAKEDGNVRIVFKDWAIFGEPSVEAARRALAARYQGKDKAFDDALMQIQGKQIGRASGRERVCQYV